MSDGARLAVSSIAWAPQQDLDARALFRRVGVRGIELTPLKYWPTAPDVSPQAVAECRAFWSDAGMEIIALQGILFGKTDAMLFASDRERAALEELLVGMAHLAAGLGARTVVFGAPANRRRGSLTEDEAVANAVPMFQRVGDAYASVGCALAIEPNPPRYGADFCRTIAEVQTLVRAVGHPGVRLHLDAGAIVIQDETRAAVTSAASEAQHFHISEVDLVAVGAGTVDHAQIGRWLHEGGYDGWHSIEMRPPADETFEEAMARAVLIALESYGLE